MSGATNTPCNDHSNTKIHDLFSMRLAQEPWRWRKAILKADLTAATKVAAFAVLEFINRKSGFCFASYATIAEACGMTERGVRAAVKALGQAGLIRVVQRGARKTNHIYLALPGGTAAEGDRHGVVAVTGMAMPPNLRYNSRDRTLETQTDRVEREGPSPAKVISEGKKEEDYPLRRAADDEIAIIFIGNAAIRILGYSLGACPKTADGRYLDRAIRESIPADRLEIMVQKARKGVLMASEVADVVWSLGYRPARQEAA